MTGTGGQPGQQEHQCRRVAVLGDLFDGDGEAEDPGARSALRLGDAEAEEAGVAEHLEEVLRVLAALVDLPRPGLDLVLGDAAARSPAARPVPQRARSPWPPTVPDRPGCQS